MICSCGGVLVAVVINKYLGFPFFPNPMPITTRIPIRRLSQSEFGDIAYQVMKHVFAIHNEIGSFFDEKIYKLELAQRLPGIGQEEPVEVTLRAFRKTYFLDVLVADGGLFEFNAVDSLAGRHRAQLLNYLPLCDLAHGKLINVRTEDVQQIPNCWCCD